MFKYIDTETTEAIVNWYKGYAECYYCKNQNGPWILENQKFICEDCYERRKEHDKKRKTNNTRQPNKNIKKL